MYETPKPTLPAKTAVPPGACDTHTHVFGPFDRFPFPVTPSYDPPNAPFEVHRAMLDAAGIDRCVLVQPSPYATDTRALSDALMRGNGSLRGIAAARGDTPDETLVALDKVGVRGLRFTEMLDPKGGGRYFGATGMDEFPALAGRMSSLGWHPHVWAKCQDCCTIAETHASSGLFFVFDHMACVPTQNGTQDPTFQRLLALVREGRIWIKLTLCRNSKAAPSYDDLRPFHDVLIEANPDRMLWGSDWPFVRMGDAAPNVGRLLDIFLTWVDDPALQRKILVDNPQTLYRFS